MNFVFGKTFWSTVIRSAVFFPLLSLLSVPIAIEFASSNELRELRSVNPATWVVYLLWGSLFGSWVGWGLAYWRFRVQPVRPGGFARYPLATGLIHGPVFWVFIDELSKADPDIAKERLAATVFGLIVGPPMALLMAVFWRYALQFTALRHPIQGGGAGKAK